jgi:hypothetical protein
VNAWRGGIDARELLVVASYTQGGQREEKNGFRDFYN